MNFTHKILSNKQKEDIEHLFGKFYRKYADEALPGQVDFVDSIYDQFQASEYLSEKQLAGLRNIIDSCDNFEEYRNEINWE